MAPTPSISEIERLVGRSTDREPPFWLAAKVMAEVRARPRSLASRFSSWLVRPPQLVISPFGLFTTVVTAVIAFWGGKALFIRNGTYRRVHSEQGIEVRVQRYRCKLSNSPQFKVWRLGIDPALEDWQDRYAASMSPSMNRFR